MDTWKDNWKSKVLWDFWDNFKKLVDLQFHFPLTKICQKRQLVNNLKGKETRLFETPKLLLLGGHREYFFSHNSAIPEETGITKTGKTIEELQ